MVGTYLFPNRFIVRIAGFALIIPLSLSSFSLNHSTVKKLIPVMKVNFYLMGQEEVNEDHTLSIGENMAFLNSAFDGEVQFEIDALFMDENGAFLPDLHRDFISGKKNAIEQLLDPIETSGAINVFIFHTYAESRTGQALTGFTPILSRLQNSYAYNSPKFDRIFISYEGLMSGSTLVHEMGHFLGLKHPWEMHPLERKKMGLDRENLGRNHMSYNDKTKEFTKAQLYEMRKYAFKYRAYLMDRKISMYN